MIAYITGWGVFGGAGLGAVYGMITAFFMLMNMQRSSSITTLFDGLLLSLMGAPFGALFGGIAGALLGVANGFSVGLLTWMLFSLSRNWGWYRLSVGAVSAGVALVGGVMVFGMFIRPYSLGDFIFHAGTPALIAAVVFVHASQRAARRHLASVTASKPYVRV
jgi:hypothetical protein